MNNKTNFYLSINALIFAIATAVAAYMAYHHYIVINGDAGFASFCSVNEAFDCDLVNTSKYSEFLGIPIATWALAYYLWAFILNLVGRRNVYARRETVLLSLDLSILGMIVTVIMAGISFFSLKTGCIMCITLYTFNTLTFIFTVLTWRSMDLPGGLIGQVSQVNWKNIMGYGALGLVILVVSHLFTVRYASNVYFDEDAFRSTFQASQKFEIEPGDHSPRMGFQGDNPLVQIVEFADFECPACGIAAKKIHRLLKLYGDKIQVVFRNYPLDLACNTSIQRRIHDHACIAAKAALCAHKAGKFKDMYIKLFENQKNLSRDNIFAWAEEIGISGPELSSCVESDEVKLQIQKDIDYANSVSIQSTPTFFFNGKKLEGFIDENRLKVIIDEFEKK